MGAASSFPLSKARPAAPPPPLTDFLVGESHDDADETNDKKLDRTAETMRIGSEFAKSGDIYDCGFRIPNVTIPPGSTIDRAEIRFNVESFVGSPLVLFTVFADMSSANPPVWANNNRPSGITPSTNFVSVGITAPGVWTVTSDFEPILQEVIDGPGWASGNAVRFWMRRDFSPENHALITTFDAADNSLRMSIGVAWT